MKIIIVPDDAAGFAAAPPKTLEFPAKRLWVGLAAAACILVFAVYALARHTAYGWLEAKTPLAQSLVAELETRLDAENRRRQKGTRAAFGAQFAELRARLAELRANGAMLAGRVGLAEGEMFAAVPDACAAAELKQTGAAEEELAHLNGVFSEIKKRYGVVLRHGAVAAVTYDTVPMLRPVGGRHWLSSRFGTRRDPLTGRRAFHSGYDYAARRGVAVFAAAAGRVDYSGRLGNYGNAVRISHGGNLSTLYGHLHSFVVKKGQYVRRGEVIGAVGNTGRSTGPHLHYEVRVNNRPRPINSAVKKIRRARAVPKQWAL